MPAAGDTGGIRDLLHAVGGVRYQDQPICGRRQQRDDVPETVVAQRPLAPLAPHWCREDLQIVEAVGE